MSQWVITTFEGTPTAEATDPDLRALIDAVPGDSALDDDFQLALHCIYDLSYRGFRGVDDRWEWNARILALRGLLEERFQRDLREAVAESGLDRGAESVDEVLERGSGPSLSGHMIAAGTRREFVEFCIHRSAYQLKEADPHTLGLSRFSGPRKAAFVEIQADEYGNGEVGEAHADLFADVMSALGLDARYGVYVDALPAVTLATDNLVTLLGSHRSLRSALLGHLAGFEMTSVTPMSRYAAAARRLDLGPRVERFYDVHVAADEHHGRLAATQLVGGDPEGDGLSTSEILFGAAVLMVLEERLARHLLDSWALGRSSLRPVASSN